VGASEWMYFTDYDRDPDHALRRLREEVFVERRFKQAWQFPDVFGGLWELEELGLRRRLLLWAVESMFTTLEMVRWAFRGFRRPRTIDEALEWGGEDGTHSILDVERTSMYRQPGTAIPLSEPRLREIFGTTEPTREQVEERAGEVACLLRRGEAVYFPVYEDGQPRQLAFLGCTGD
jgi:hypothetical protein